MKRWTQGLAPAALALFLAGGTAPAGEGGSWVGSGGEAHAIHGGKTVFVGDEGAERFDLSALADGETRTFGAGARAVTASRKANSVSISRGGSGDEVSAIDVTCELDKDTCTVLTFPDDPEKVMIAIEKERSCVNGIGDCDVAVGEGVPAGAHVVVDIDCEGDDCGEFQTLHLDGLSGLENVFEIEAGDGDGGEASRIVIRRLGTDGAKAHKVFVSAEGASAAGALARVPAPDGGKVMLRCTEGDATITVDGKEADDTFLCPKHSTPMERVKQFGRGVRVIREAEPHKH